MVYMYKKNHIHGIHNVYTYVQQYKIIII